MRQVAKGLGYALAVSDKKVLADKIQYVLNHRPEAAAKAKVAVQAIRNLHDWQAIAGQYNDLYLSLTTGKRIE